MFFYLSKIFWFVVQPLSVVMIVIALGFVAGIAGWRRTAAWVSGTGLAMLLLIGATFFIADGVQTTSAGALRGMHDTQVPLLFAVISYWLIGFASASALAFWAGLQAPGVWIGLSLGTAVYATLLILRFRLLARRLGR